MLSRIHEKLGTAGFVISIVALIAALTGGAYAAGALNPQVKKQITKESKKFSKKFSKQFAVPGPQGAKGDTGAPGGKGDTGAKGDTGSPGANGVSGTNGEDGMCSEAQPECVLPPGGTLTGTWAASGGAEDLSLATISFPLKVTPAPTAIQESNTQVFGHTIGAQLENEKAEFVGPYKSIGAILGSGKPLGEAAEEDEKAYKAICPGSAAKPEAKAGYLCIYKVDQSGDPLPPTTLATSVRAASEYGIAVPWKFGNAEPGFIRGTWAVTSQG